MKHLKIQLQSNLTLILHPASHEAIAALCEDLVWGMGQHSATSRCEHDNDAGCTDLAASSSL